MKIDELGLQIGCPIQIQLLDDEAKRYTVKLIGFQRGQGLIISAPRSSGSDLSMILREDQPLNVRVKSFKYAIAFRSQIIEKRLTPFPHVHIAIPDNIESVSELKAGMIPLKQDITLINDDEDCHSSQAELVGISFSKAKIRHGELLANKGQRVTLTMSFSFAGVNNVIVLEGLISATDTDDDTGQFVMTLTYEELDQSDKILLHAYIYECMLINIKILA